MVILGIILAYFSIKHILCIELMFVGGERAKIVCQKMKNIVKSYPFERWEYSIQFE